MGSSRSRENNNKDLGESSVSLWMHMNRQMDNCPLMSKKHASQIGLSL